MAKNGTRDRGGVAWPAIVFPVVAAGAAAAWLLTRDEAADLRKKATKKATEIGNRLFGNAESGRSSSHRVRRVVRSVTRSMGGKSNGGRSSSGGGRGGRGRTGARSTRTRTRSRTSSSSD